MANELHAYSSSGSTLYAVLLKVTGEAWNGSTFEALAGANWTTYALPLAEAAAGVYLGALPAVGTGEYSYVVYEQAGATPATTDKLRGAGSLLWDGANVALPALEATVQGIKAKTDNLPADPASASDMPSAAPTPGQIFGWINPDTGISASEYLTGIGALQSSASLIQASVDEILADTGTDIPALIAAGNEAVAGAERYTYTLTSSVDGAPIMGADVWLTSDEAGDLAVASGRTDVQGQVRFYVDPGTYYLWRQLAGWVFSNPTTVVVTGA